MKSHNTRRKFTVLAAALGLLAPSLIHAAPYACDLTNNGSGTVSFRLNENADNVQVISSGGAITNNLGPGLKGLTITNIGVAPGVIKVMVSRSAPVGYTQTSVDLFQDANSVFVNKFEQPRGLAVNKVPSSPAFGRIYIANGQNGTTAVGPRQTFDGIYMINSDDSVALDTGVTPRTADLPFDTGNAVSPFRVTVGKDDGRLYITDDSDPRGGLWVTDADVATNSIATNVLWQIGDLTQGATNHGSIYSAVVEGSLANNNLKIFTMDEDLLPVRSAWRYDINGGPLPFTGPTNIVNPVGFINGAIKLVRGGSSNYFYTSQNRSAGTDGPSIVIFREDGVTITNSLAYTRSNFNASAADIFRNVTSIDISPDGNTLALLRGAAFGNVLLVPLTNGLITTTGTNAFTLGTSGASDNNRDIAYDAAGNLYAVNTGTEWFRIYSKGGATVFITGTDGTFVTGVPPTLVNVVATTATGNETGPANGVFRIARVGDTTAPLTVNYTTAGTATAGTDYTALSGSVTFLANASQTNITVPVLDDPDTELTETVILNITASANYGVSTNGAVVSILDNEPTVVSVALATTNSTLLEGCSECKVGMRLTRRGLIGPALSVNLGYSGTAVLGGQYNAPSSVAIAASTATALVNLTTVDNVNFDPTNSIIVTVNAGGSYVPAAPLSASATVVDDDGPIGTAIFSDNFDTDSSANWITNSNDNYVDSSFTFAYDYTNKFVPPIPGITTTKALLFRLNELPSAPVNAIGASPLLTAALPDEYRMRFKMWINYNGPMLDGGSGSTYHLNAGVGTTPDHANSATYGGSDGVWFSVDGDGGSTLTAGDANVYVANSLASDGSGFYTAGTTDNPRSTGNPYYALWGGLTAPPAQLAAFPTQTGTSQAGNMGISWHTVVITKTSSNITWVIDGINIATVPQELTTYGTNVFVGFSDQFPGAAGNTNVSFALVDNFRVESLAAPVLITITKQEVIGSNVKLTFTGPAATPAASFKVFSSSTVTGTYTDTGVTPTSLGGGTFEALVPLSGPTQFYKIRL